MAKKKEPWRKYLLPIAREEREINYQCFADPRMFLPEFTDLPKPMQDLFKGEDKIDLPCQGGGNPGPWCEECVFGESQE